MTGIPTYHECQLRCKERTDPPCSGIEWYDGGWGGSQCKHIIGTLRATQGSVTAGGEARRWHDAKCFARNGVCTEPGMEGYDGPNGDRAELCTVHARAAYESGAGGCKQDHTANDGKEEDFETVGGRSACPRATSTARICLHRNRH